MPIPDPASEERFEHFLGKLLRVGVLASAVVVMVGGIIYLIHHGAENTHYERFNEEPGPLRSPGGIVANVVSLHGRAIIQLGLLLLIATPVARVVCSIVGFARQRDRTYVGLTLFVLAVLLYSLFLEGP